MCRRRADGVDGRSASQPPTRPAERPLAWRLTLLPFAPPLAPAALPGLPPPALLLLQPCFVLSLRAHPTRRPLLSASATVFALPSPSRRAATTAASSFSSPRVELRSQRRSRWPRSGRLATRRVRMTRVRPHFRRLRSRLAPPPTSRSTLVTRSVARPSRVMLRQLEPRVCLRLPPASTRSTSVGRMRLTRRLRRTTGRPPMLAATTATAIPHHLFRHLLARRRLRLLLLLPSRRVPPLPAVSSATLPPPRSPHLGPVLWTCRVWSVMTRRRQRRRSRCSRGTLRTGRVHLWSTWSRALPPPRSAGMTPSTLFFARLPLRRTWRFLRLTGLSPTGFLTDRCARGSPLSATPLCSSLGLPLAAVARVACPPAARCLPGSLTRSTWCSVLPQTLRPWCSPAASAVVLRPHRRRRSWLARSMAGIAVGGSLQRCESSPCVLLLASG